MEIRRVTTIKDGTNTVGNRTRVKIVKNKVAPPFKMTEFDIMYGRGISYNGELVDLGVKAEIIEKAGSWYSYKEERIGQGRENVKQYLEDNPETATSLASAIKNTLGPINDIEESNIEEDNTIEKTATNSE